jgi:hypothetical protein
MKILRAGAPWTLTVECLKCHSLLLIEEHDISLEQTYPPIRGEDYGENRWKCTNCGGSYVIKGVPEHVSVLARSKAKWNVGQGQ